MFHLILLLSVHLSLCLLEKEDSSWFCGFQTRSCWHHHHISPFAGNLGACVKVAKLFRAQLDFWEWSSADLMLEKRKVGHWDRSQSWTIHKEDRSRFLRIVIINQHRHHHYIIGIIMIAISIVEGQLTKKIIRRTGLANQQRELGLTQHLHKSNGPVAASVRKNEMPNS